LRAPVNPVAKLSDVSALSPRSTIPVKGRPRTSYVVRLGNGDDIGPLGPLELIDGFATRRYPLESLVLKNGARPRPARSLPELRGVVGVEAFIAEVLAARNLVRVKLDRTRLAGFLYGLVEREETGIVLLEDGSRKLAISFNQGAPVSAISSDRDYLLGTQLVNQGLIDEPRLCEAMDLLVEVPTRVGGGAGRLGELLIEQRWVDSSELLRVLVAQLESRVIGLGRWSSGEVCFVAGTEHVRGQLTTETPPLHLVTKAVRAGFSGRELARILSALGDNPVARNPVARTTAESLGLTPSELEALKSVAGTHSLGRFLAEAVTAQGLKPDDILRAVFIGMSAGLLVSPGWPWR
jgi:hypothetical protein